MTPPKADYVKWQWMSAIGASGLPMRAIDVRFRGNGNLFIYLGHCCKEARQRCAFLNSTKVSELQTQIFDVAAGRKSPLAI